MSLFSETSLNRSVTNTFYSVRITETGADLFSSVYRFIDERSFNFDNLQATIDFIAQRYENRKRQKMYVDGENGEALHVGWVYKYRNADVSHSPVEQWNQCDWVQIVEVREDTVTF